MSVHDRRREAIAALCLAPIARCSALAAGKVADARAHAARAISGALVAAPDGRATLARAARNRSLRAAGARLGELADALAGPAVNSLSGAVRDAWEASYRDGRSYWPDHLGPDVRRDSLSPSTGEIAAARGLVLGGYDLRSRMTAVLDPAYRRLRATVISAASPSRPARDRSGSLRAWEVATTRAMAAAIRPAVLTGAFRCDVLAGRASIRPELLHDDPTLG